MTKTEERNHSHFRTLEKRVSMKESSLDELELAPLAEERSLSGPRQEDADEPGKEHLLLDKDWLYRNLLNWTDQHPRKSQWNEPDDRVLSQLLSQTPVAPAFHLFGDFQERVNALPDGKETAGRIIERFKFFFLRISNFIYVSIKIFNDI